MIQKTFGIYGDENSLCKLLIEIGTQHVACWLKDTENNKIIAFEFFQYDIKNYEGFNEAVKQIKLNSKLLNGAYTSSQIIWEHEECLIVPLKFYDVDLEENYLTTIFGDNTNCIYSRQLMDENVLVYRNAALWNETINNNFTEATLTHKYYFIVTNWLRNKENYSENFIRLLFYNQHFILFAVKEKQLQLINSFQYQTPADALYHSLNTCGRLQMDKHETLFLLSGLIDLQSKLYKELNQYLPHLKLSELAAETLSAQAFKEQPLHYFSSFFTVEE
ncbi:MAG: DUF3822 family protein [Chitinophagaceae bacterium]